MNDDAYVVYMPSDELSITTFTLDDKKVSKSSRFANLKIKIATPENPIIVYFD